MYETKCCQVSVLHMCISACYRGDNPAECDKKFLSVACKLDRYGMDFHYITVSWGWIIVQHIHSLIHLFTPILGCVQCGSGCGCVFTGPDSVLWWRSTHITKPLPMVYIYINCSRSVCAQTIKGGKNAISIWSYLVYRVRIGAVNFKGKQLLLEMMPPPVRTRSPPSPHLFITTPLSVLSQQNQSYSETIVMNCRTKVACKTMWKSCVEHHSFFRWHMVNSDT